MANGTALGYTSSSNLALTDRFEVVKDIGDGSFGSVVLAKVRSAGSNVARRGSVVAIKTMKKTFESFAPCLELREVIFLRQLPAHAHLVPALDIFLDPHSKKLHIAMEYMDGNLYQLMKAREGKLLDGSVVKSILFQILSGLGHIHDHGFFHRDIKPENILVSTSAQSAHETGSFRRYSSMVTPPSTPPVYSVKIADFGLARETSSKMPYTTYVSTRWYRAPEVLLRAGEYSAPVDIWAVGAMAVEVATLKPLFPGGNEVDQVWRICEVMGSPGQWIGRGGKKIGGGEWREGGRLAGRLGFSFPRMAPVPMESILQSPTWPVGLSNFVTWCLMWDPRSRPTSLQAVQHDYFRDAVDPLLPRSSRLAKKTSDITIRSASGTLMDGHPSLEKKASWFRTSFIGRRSDGIVSPPPTTSVEKEYKSTAEKRRTWHAPKANNEPTGAPIMILPSIKPVSPLSDAVSAQAVKGREQNYSEKEVKGDGRMSKKIGRQLSVASTHSQRNGIEAAHDKLNGNSGLVSPTPSQKEGFFSHLRKRARRLSGRNGLPPSPEDDIEPGLGCIAWGGSMKDAGSNRSSMLVETPSDPSSLDKAIREVDDALADSNTANSNRSSIGSNSNLRASLQRNLSFPPTPNASRSGEQPTSLNATVNTNTANQGAFSRTRKSVRDTRPKYETPDENDEIMDEVLTAASAYVSPRHSQNYDNNTIHTSTPMRKSSNPGLRQQHSAVHLPTGYPSPTPSLPTRQFSLREQRSKEDPNQPTKWPTPPSEGDPWGINQASYSAAISAGGRR